MNLIIKKFYKKNRILIEIVKPIRNNYFIIFIKELLCLKNYTEQICVPYARMRAFLFIYFLYAAFFSFFSLVDIPYLLRPVSNPLFYRLIHMADSKNYILLHDILLWLTLKVWENIR